MNRVLPILRLLCTATFLALAGCASAPAKPESAPSRPYDPNEDTYLMGVYHQQTQMYLDMIRMDQEATTWDSTAITARLDTATAAWNRGDLEGFLAPYALDARYVTSQGETIGRTAIRQGYESGAFGDIPRSGRLAFQYVSSRSLGDNFRLVVGRWVLTDPATGRERTRMSTLIFRRTNWQLEIMHEHSS